MPPLEFDYPYTGRLTVSRVNPDQMRGRCPLPSPGRVTVGCAHVGRGECEIIIANDEWLKALGWNADVITRHERAHCEGWPADHPGARSPAELAIRG